MKMLAHPQEARQRLIDMERDMAWLGRRVHRTRQRIGQILRGENTLVPDDLAAAIERELGAPGLFQDPPQ